MLNITVPLNYTLSHFQWGFVDVSDIQRWKNAAVPNGFGQCLLMGFKYPWKDWTETRAPSPLAEAAIPWHGKIMRSSLAWGHGATSTGAAAAAALETGRGKFKVHSITLCSIPSNLREDLSLKCSQKKYFWHSCTWAGLAAITGLAVMLSWTHAVVETTVALLGISVVPFLSWQW